MIIKIKKIPDIPLFDELPKKIKKKLIGLKFQTTRIGAAYTMDTMSRKVHRALNYQLVSQSNFLDALYEIDREIPESNLHEIFEKLLEFDREKRNVGFIFAAEEFKII